ncbi:sulfotransferase [Dyella sp. KRB-257]|uniref:tetratricopeptide repeat-containing sulfotransferase family protein n=1 Tax=Dyella sp. KRB-257 TaxID=3400915 RepID=UPI003BFAE5C1
MTLPPPRTAVDPRLSGLSVSQREQLHAAARAIRDGQLDAADRLLDALHRLAPCHVEVLRMKGIAATRRGRVDDAIAVLRKALALAPHDALVLNDLASALARRGDMHDALTIWRQACMAAPDYPIAWFNLGRNLQQLGDSEEALRALKQATALAPELLPAHILAGDTLVHLGRFDEAAAHYRAALARHGACGDAWRGLANIKTQPLGDADIAALSSLVQYPGVADSDRIAMGFALGKALEDRGRYEDAFAALAAANARMRQLAPWHAPTFSTHVTRVLEAGHRLPAPLDATLGREVIFIVGLPRSGSTLFEQILAAHPQVEGASELDDLDAVIVEESRQRRQPLLAWMPSASAADWHRLGQRYLERTARWRTQRPRHTDKLPENWLHAGLLGAMLPGARIVDARRDALEAGWSCFKQQFYRLPHFACDLGDIGAYTRDYRRAMAIWQAEQPQRVRIQRYEALLDEPEREIRDLLAFCNLPFDAACLDYHRAMRSVRTPSASQVRQPLRRDTARAERYGALLDPLRQALADAG